MRADQMPRNSARDYDDEWPALPRIHHVYAIECEYPDRQVHVIAVSAESEYGAVKRLVGNRFCRIIRLVKTDKTPEFDQRRIEGHIDYDVSDAPRWEYT